MKIGEDRGCGGPWGRETGWERCPRRECSEPEGVCACQLIYVCACQP